MPANIDDARVHAVRNTRVSRVASMLGATAGIVTLLSAAISPLSGRVQIDHSMLRRLETAVVRRLNPLFQIREHPRLQREVRTAVDPPVDLLRGGDEPPARRARIPGGRSARPIAVVGTRGRLLRRRLAPSQS